MLKLSLCGLYVQWIERPPDEIDRTSASAVYYKCNASGMKAIKHAYKRATLNDPFTVPLEASVCIHSIYITHLLSWGYVAYAERSDHVAVEIS